MKKTAIKLSIFLLAVSPMLLVSCSKTEEPAAIDRDIEIVLRGSQAQYTGEDQETKTIFGDGKVYWETGDPVGMFSPQAKSFIYSTKLGINNKKFTADADGEDVPFSGNVYWGSGNHDFYSYYPYKDDGCSTEGCKSYDYDCITMRAVPINSIRYQYQPGSNTTTHFKSYDFMIATPLLNYAPPTTGKIVSLVLKYNHLLTIVKVKPVLPAGTSPKTLTYLEISKPSGGLYISFSGNTTTNITQTPPADGAPYVVSMDDKYNYVRVYPKIGSTITLTDDINTTATIYAFGNAGDYTGVTFTFKVVTNNGSYVGTRSGRVLKRSVIHNVNLYTTSEIQ